MHIHIAEQTKEVEDCIACPVRARSNGCWIMLRRRSLVPDPRHPPDGSGSGEYGHKRRGSPVSARSPRPISVTVRSQPPHSFQRAAASASGRIPTCRFLSRANCASSNIRNVLAHRAATSFRHRTDQTGRRLFDAAIYGGHRLLRRRRGWLQAPRRYRCSRYRNASYLAEDSLLDNWIFRWRCHSRKRLGCRQQEGRQRPARSTRQDPKHFAKTMQALLSG